MGNTNIKNVVFDVGNVLVRWAPYEVIALVFPERDPVTFYEAMHPIWIDLNLGKISENQAVLACHKQFNISIEQLNKLMFEFKKSQTMIPGSLELLKKLFTANIPIYAITDNIKELIEYHRHHSNFLHYFNGIVVSADLGILKPDPKIYQHLLTTYQLNPEECIFIDDLMINVKGALKVGMQSFQFVDAKSCEDNLIALGINL